MRDRREYHKEYYRQHRKQILENNHKRLVFIQGIKESSGCVICGETDPCCLEFHHLNPDEKELQVSEQHNNLERVLKEIEKCIVVCSNCHRKIHAGKINVNDFVVQRQTQRAQTS